MGREERPGGAYFLGERLCQRLSERVDSERTGLDVIISLGLMIQHKPLPPLRM